MPKGRRPSRLSSLDLLPTEAEEDIAWAKEELRAKKRLQQDILSELNLKLTIKGIKPISASAFSRAFLRMQAAISRFEEMREIAAVVAEKLEVGAGEDITLMVSELIKTLIYETLEDAGQLRVNGATAEMLANFALALKSAEQSRKLTADMRLGVVRDLEKRAAKAIDAVGKERGLTAETVKDIKSAFLNLKAA